MPNIEVKFAVGDRVVLAAMPHRAGTVRSIHVTSLERYAVILDDGIRMGELNPNALRPVPSLADGIEDLPEVVELVKQSRDCGGLLDVIGGNFGHRRCLKAALKPFDGIGE